LYNAITNKQTRASKIPENNETITTIIQNKETG